MPELDALAKAVNDNLIVPVRTQSGIRNVMLKESDPSAKLRQVRITGLDARSIVLKIDRVGPFDSLLRSAKGPHYRCDYLILTEHGGQKFAIFIELKSAHFSKSKCEKQFKGSRCVLSYCDSVLEEFHGVPDGLRAYEHRFVIFCRKLQNKTTTRIARPRRNTNPESAHQIVNPTRTRIAELLP